MFRNDLLEEHLKTSSTIRLNSVVAAEWNMNIASNIKKIGNYRYRANDPRFPEYNFIAQSFSDDDEQNRFYTGATDADVVIDGGIEDDGTPLAFVASKEKEKLLYSLEDCFGRFRPRSGINKLRYFDNKYSHFSNIDMVERPRYYMPSKDDDFKYWTSYRTEDGIERGIANIVLNNQNFIDDTAPFVVYENPVPSNRIVVKMQTNVGTKDLGPFIRNGAQFSDPFFGFQNQTTPVRWRIEYLDQQNTWITAAAFDENSLRPDFSRIINSDGYVELFYGIKVPEEFRNNFKLEKTLSSEISLPGAVNLRDGIAYLVVENENELGTVYVVQDREYKTFEPEYGWYIENEDIAVKSGFVQVLNNPPMFIDQTTEEVVYREFQYIYGLRVVVETMNVFDSTFDLIELSPRLAVDISDKVSKFEITRSASDLGVAGLPVGQLLASVGSVDIFDFDQAFFPDNPNSIVAPYTSQNIQFKFYEVVQDVKGFDFYIPIKTMYSEGFPDISGTDRSVVIPLRDLFFYFEARNAPQIFVQNVSLSYAISLLLDSIGFSNYVFFRNPGEQDDIIPFFFVPPDQTLAETLEDLSRSTQTAMFFDEYNNFVMMSKNYILPEPEERATDIVLYGSKDFEREDEVKNKKTRDELSNIIDVSFRENQVYNAGLINYQTRSIQRSYGSIRQASMIDRDKTWIYKPVLLWEAEGQENVRSQNDELEEQSAFALTAIPLNSRLTAQIPRVRNHKITDNIIDFGDGVYWTARYDGYFFANGEIIRYDAIEFSIPGLSAVEPENPNIQGDNVWITSVAEYQGYFSKIPFNGKMYPTGRVRIYAEPHFEVVDGVTRLKNGPVAKHGRGQFGTEIVNHPAGLDPYWRNINNRRGCRMDFKYVFRESITRAKLGQAILISNASSGAVLEVNDVTNVRRGDYAFREYSSAETDSNTGQPPPNNRIRINTRVASVNKSKKRVTFDKNLTDILANKDTLVNTRSFSNAKYVSSTTIEVSSVDNLTTGMYVIYSPSPNTKKKFNVPQTNSTIISINKKKKTITLNKTLQNRNKSKPVEIAIGRIRLGTIVLQEQAPPTIRGKAGIETKVYKNSTISGTIKNVFSSPYLEEMPTGSRYSATVQSSALVFKGNVTNTTAPSKDFISYVFKQLDKPYRHFGTRMRIIGRIENDEFRGQTAEGASTYFSGENKVTGESPTISGGSGGLAIMINPDTNEGYYFEIAALSDNKQSNPISNIMFYKIQRRAPGPSGSAISIQEALSITDSTSAIPIRLFTGLGDINVDDGTFVGQSRLSVEDTPTVYDLAVEYQNSGGARRFFLYINNVMVGIAEDPSPLPVVNNMALFVRGNAKCMFENVYALTRNYSQNTTFALDTPINSVFGEISPNAQNSMLRYSLSGLVQGTYLSGIGSQEPPKYNIYFEEFGTIMREAAYFNIRYDKAYPALYAKIAETFSRVKGYTVSGFLASAYGAEFLVFNHTDTILNLDSSSGNYLRIQGVTFTQQSANEFSVDDYFQNRTNFANPIYVEEGAVLSPVDEKRYYTDIKLSRITEGTKEFVLDAPYIQSKDAAEKMMGWLVKKIMQPKKAVGVSVFGMPHLQLGDIVEFEYVSNEGVPQISQPGKRFVVYHIEYTRTVDDIVNNVFLSEVT